MRPHLHGMLPDDLREHLRAAGVSVRDDEARRILALEHWGRGRAHPPRRPLSRRLLAAVEELVDRAPLEVAERVEDPADGFVKYLLRSPDGAESEAVRIPLHVKGRYSVCLSSQVGCAMGCRFCATGKLGLVRSLEAWEMVSAWRIVRDDAPGRVSGAVFMGQGEPFQNYENVIQAARVLSNSCCGRIAAGAISISTVGIPSKIRRYAHERHKYRLIVSLTSAIQEKRATLMPAASAHDVEEIADALREYASVARGRVTVAWVVLAGVNTGSDEVEALRRLLDGIPLRVNLVDVNDPRPDGFGRAGPEELAAWMGRLQVLRAPVVRRYSGGASRHAACGMLVGKRFFGASPPAGYSPPGS